MLIMLHRLCVEYHQQIILPARILEVTLYVALRGTQTLECYLCRNMREYFTMPLYAFFQCSIFIYVILMS